ncbi:hypothetical protein FKM82_003877 [Ascaphus truei]
MCLSVFDQQNSFFIDCCLASSPGPREDTQRPAGKPGGPQRPGRIIWKPTDIHGVHPGTHASLWYQSCVSKK